MKILTKTVLFRNIALIFSLEKPCYLENRVVREPCKRRSACILKFRWTFKADYYGWNNEMEEKFKAYLIEYLRFFCKIETDMSVKVPLTR